MTTAGTRRRRLSPAERRDQLMAATVDALADLGFAGTTADEIARRAGVSKGLVWHYFTDLDDLLDTTARRTLTTLQRAVGDAVDLTAPAPQVIRAAVHAAAALRLTHGRERRALSEIILNLRTPTGDLRLGHDDLGDLYARQEEIFRRGQADGDVREDLDPTLLAVTYQGAVDSMLGYLDAHPHTDATRHADTVADVLLGGMTRR